MCKQSFQLPSCSPVGLRDMMLTHRDLMLEHLKLIVLTTPPSFSSRPPGASATCYGCCWPGASCGLVLQPGKVQR